MQAAERIFEGAFDDVVDEDGDAQMSVVGASTSGRDVKLSGLAVRIVTDCCPENPVHRTLQTPDEDEDGPADSGDMAEDDDEDDDDGDEGQSLS